jgi:hypothetical protein
MPTTTGAVAGHYDVGPWEIDRSAEATEFVFNPNRAGKGSAVIRHTRLVQAEVRGEPAGN